MNECCENIDSEHTLDDKYRRVLWVILVINALMFIVELASGLYSGSQSLLADSIDFFGDSAMYGISLYVFNKSLQERARASIIQGSMMGMYGIVIVASTIYKIFVVGVPQAEIMGIVGFLALFANVYSAFLLFKYRRGDSNRQSVWISSVNDAIANIAIILAGAGVFITSSKFPDLFVAFIIASIEIRGSLKILKQAKGELKKST